MCQHVPRSADCRYPKVAHPDEGRGSPWHPWLQVADTHVCLIVLPTLIIMFIACYVSHCVVDGCAHFLCFLLFALGRFIDILPKTMHTTYCELDIHSKALQMVQDLQPPPPKRPKFTPTPKQPTVPPPFEMVRAAQSVAKADFMRTKADFMRAKDKYEVLSTVLYKEFQQKMQADLGAQCQKFDMLARLLALFARSFDCFFRPLV